MYLSNKKLLRIWPCQIFSLTLVLQIKTSKIINGVAKVQQKSEKISVFGGIFFVLDKFDRILSSDLITYFVALAGKRIDFTKSISCLRSSSV